MAIIHDWDDETTAQWNEWVASRPAVVQELCRRLPPNRLYRLEGTGHRCTIYSYAEDGTLTVAITGEYNLVQLERRVFGIKPEDLTECDLPAPGEPLGAPDKETQKQVFEKAKDRYQRDTAHERN